MSSEIYFKSLNSVFYPYFKIPFFFSVFREKVSVTLAQCRTKQKAGSRYEPFIKDDAKELCEAL